MANDVLDPGDIDLDFGMTDEERQIQRQGVASKVIMYPRLYMTQPGTPEVAKGSGSHRGGQFMDSVTREILSTKDLAPWMQGLGLPERDIPVLEYIPIVPLVVLPVDFARWCNKETDGRDGLDWKTLDDQDPRVRNGTWAPYGRWKAQKDGDRPPVTVGINMLVSSIDLSTGMPKGGILIATFSGKKAYKTGRKVVTAINTLENAGKDPWDLVQFLYSESDSDSAGHVYFNWQHAIGGAQFGLKKVIGTNQTAALGWRTLFRNVVKPLLNPVDGEGRRLQEAILAASPDVPDENFADSSLPRTNDSEF